MNKAIVHQNLEKLLSKRRGGGMYILDREAKRGYHDFSEQLKNTVHFIYNPITDSILFFTRIQRPSHIAHAEDLQVGYYTFNHQYRPNRWSNLFFPWRIVEMGYGPDLESHTVHTLNGTALLYNHLYGQQSL